MAKVKLTQTQATQTTQTETQTTQTKVKLTQTTVHRYWAAVAWNALLLSPVR